jgi:DNA-binding NtrC family response regulator
METRKIRETLEATGVNRSKTAGILGQSRQGLLNKITAYQIPVE